MKCFGLMEFLLFALGLVAYLDFGFVSALDQRHADVDTGFLIETAIFLDPLLLGFQYHCDCGLAGSVEGAESGEKSLFFIRNVLSKHLIIKIAQS